MPGIKLVIGMKDGTCVQKEISEEHSTALFGKKLGEAVKGDALGLAGYEFEITGGSDDCGFPMRWDVPGVARKRIFAVKGIGLKALGKGVRTRKTVAGNTVHQKTAQVNVKVTKEGAEPLKAPAAEEKKA